MALTAAPLTAAVMGAVEEQHAGIASGINNAVARSASLVAVAVFGLIMSVGFSNSFESRTANVEMPASSRAVLRARESDLMAMAVDPDLPEETRSAIAEAKTAAFLHGFRLLSLFGCGLAWLSSAIALMLLPKVRPGDS
jgi:hypothetical protein